MGQRNRAKSDSDRTRQKRLEINRQQFLASSDRQIDRFDPVAKETGVWGVQPDAGFEVNMTEQEVFENIRFGNYPVTWSV